jgi:archaellum biogenesis protein FlaJ (TadC family)
MKTALTITLLILSLGVKGQSKLPTTAIIKLTDKQVLKLDSAINIISQQLDSKSLTNFLQQAVAPIYQQVREQMVADKPKEVKKQ